MIKKRSHFLGVLPFNPIMNTILWDMKGIKKYVLELPRCFPDGSSLKILCLSKKNIFSKIIVNIMLKKINSKVLFFDEAIIHYLDNYHDFPDYEGKSVNISDSLEKLKNAIKKR